jgi:hypothetical protein
MACKYPERLFQVLFPHLECHALYGKLFHHTPRDTSEGEKHEPGAQGSCESFGLELQDNPGVDRELLGNCRSVSSWQKVRGYVPYTPFNPLGRLLTAAFRSSTLH